MKKQWAVILTGLILTAICGSWYRPNQSLQWLHSLRNIGHDYLSQTIHSPPQSGEVAILDIDEVSLQRYGQWPWPRTVLADVTTQLFNSGVKVVAFDVVFPESDRTSTSDVDHDQYFAHSFQQGPVVLGCFLNTESGASVEEDLAYQGYVTRIGEGGKAPALLDAQWITKSLPVLEAAAQGRGFINTLPDRDHVVRKNPLVWAMGDNRLYPSLALDAFRLHRGIDQFLLHETKDGVSKLTYADKNILTDRLGQLVINFRTLVKKRGNTGFSFQPWYSVTSLMDGAVGEKELKGKTVFVGTSAAGLKDIRATPLTPQFSGVEVQATIFDNLLAGDSLRVPPPWMLTLNLVVTIGSGLFLTLLIARGRARSSFFVMIGLLLLATVLSVYLFKAHRIRYVPIELLLSAIMIYPVLTMLRYFQQERKTQWIREAFQSMVSEKVLQHLEANPESLSLVGHKKEATIFFSDLANFSTISEQVDPSELSELMNQYLSPMTDIILEKDGYIDKYVGDMIMAVWGVPFDVEDHALRACEAALEQQRKLKELQPMFRERFNQVVAFRMGINTGEVTAGNMGSNKRMQYTVLGDAVNQAARLEPVNKQYGTTILIGATTYAQVQHKVVARFVDEVQLKGISQKQKVYEVLCLASDKNAAACNAQKTAYESAWENVNSGNYDEAAQTLRASLKQTPDDPVCVQLLARCDEHLQQV